jgi:hypothetical protein
LAQKSSTPQWRQKLAEKKEQLKTGQAEIDTATQRLSAAKKRRDSKAEPVAKKEESSAKSSTSEPPVEAASDEVKCSGCGKAQKKAKFCNGCGSPITLEAYVC